MKKAFNILELSCLYCAAVIGAGFASGREIWQYFGRFGRYGLFSLILVCLLLAFTGCGIMLRIRRTGCTSYQHFTIDIFGAKIGKFVTLCTAALLFCTFSVMLSGSGTLLSQELHLHYPLGMLVLCAVCFILFLVDIKFIGRLNMILTLPMMIGIVVLGAYSFFYSDHSVLASFGQLLDFKDHWYISAMIYLSYNLIAVPSVLVQFSGKIKTRRVAIWAGSIGGIFLGICGVCIYLSSRNPEHLLSSMPALTTASHIGAHFKMYYAIVIYLSITTAAVSCGIGFLKHYCKQIRPLTSAILCLAGFCVAMFGFGPLVEYVYTICGTIGIVIALVLLIVSAKEVFFIKKQRK